MDQSAFRAMLASGKSAGSSSSSASRDAVLGGGGRKRAHDGGSSWAQSGSAAGASSSSSSLFKPRTHTSKSASSTSSAKGKERDAAEPPTYKRYGYTDRASMRRAGIDDGDGPARSEDAEERRPRGLDLSKLNASKKALLLGDDYVPEEEPLPQKTEEEIERELEAAERELQEPSDRQEASSSKEPEQPPAKKQKRSRADMLRDLQAKIAASAGGSASPGVDSAQSLSKYTQAQSGLSEPAVMKGFKAVEKAPEKKKKKKPKTDPQGVAHTHPEALSSTANASVRSVIDTSTSKAALPTADEPDDDMDIFAGAGDYEDDMADEESGEGQTKEDGPENGQYFEDQEELIPKFQTYRSPTPPPREARRVTDEKQERPAYNPYAEESSKESAKPQRLEGLSSSSYTARDLLAYDDAQARDEKRRLKKLKGKEKKEAMAREAEYEGSKNAEQKEKDRLNREMQEYEKYERKKGKP